MMIGLITSDDYDYDDDVDDDDKKMSTRIQPTSSKFMFYYEITC